MKTVSYQPSVMRVHDGGKNMYNMNKKRWILVGTGIMVVAFVLLVSVKMDVPDREELFFASGQQEESAEPEVSAVPENTAGPVSSEKPPQNTDVVVYICGAVKNPGVYQCRQGERISHAVERAGGLKKNAYEFVNLAESLVDGQRVYIPTKKEMVEKTQDFTDGQTTMEGSGSDVNKDSRVNINTADAAALMALPGIGESRAQSIIDYRNEHGSFQSIEEIKNISGIKEGLYSQIQELITVQ